MWRASTSLCADFYMKEISIKQLVWKLLLLVVLGGPGIAGAQSFQSSDSGDVVATFRKLGTYAEANEVLVYLGNITDFLAVPAGGTLTLSNVSNNVLTNMCPDGLNHLQWSVISAFSSGNEPTLPSSSTTFPDDTIWYTYARTNAGVQSVPVSRTADGSVNGPISGLMLSMMDNAVQISQASASNAYNNTVVCTESTSSYGPTVTGTAWDISSYIDGVRGNGITGSFAKFGYSVENTNLLATSVSDFYQNCPVGQTDPVTSTTSGNSYYVGYFTMSSSGAMTFTRASAGTPAPTAGTVAGSATNGFAGLQVTFTNTASANGTNWIWNFGDGTIITTNTSANVAHNYATNGTYTVTLIVQGAGGYATNTMTSYIKTSPKPTLKPATLSGGKLMFSGTNCPAGVRYRILTSTNLTLSVTNWTPIFTNTYLGNGSFAYTNNAMTNTRAYYRMVSP